MIPIKVARAVQLLYALQVIEFVRGLERVGYQFPRNGISIVLVTLLYLLS